MMSRWRPEFGAIGGSGRSLRCPAGAARTPYERVYDEPSLRVQRPRPSARCCRCGCAAAPPQPAVVVLRPVWSLLFRPSCVHVFRLPPALPDQAAVVPPARAAWSGPGGATAAGERPSARSVRTVPACPAAACVPPTARPCGRSCRLKSCCCYRSGQPGFSPAPRLPPALLATRTHFTSTTQSEISTGCLGGNAVCRWSPSLGEPRRLRMGESVR